MIKALIFDFDGVIIDSVDIKTKAFRKLFAQYPDKVDAIIDYHIHNMGVSRFVKFRHIYSNILNLSLSKDEELRLGEKFSELVLEEVLLAGFVAGAVEFLKQYHKKYLMYIASGTPQQELDLIVGKRGLRGYFRKIYGSPLTKEEIVMDILSQNNLEPKEVVFIGDAETDIRAAQDTGVNFIAQVNNSQHLLAGYKNKISGLHSLEDALKGYEGYKKQ